MHFLVASLSFFEPAPMPSAICWMVLAAWQLPLRAAEFARSGAALFARETQMLFLSASVHLESRDEATARLPERAAFSQAAQASLPPAGLVLCPVLVPVAAE